MTAVVPRPVVAAVPVESAHADRTAPLVCDANADGVLDNEDFRAIQAARGSPAAGPTDPRDANRNGVPDEAEIVSLEPGGAGSFHALAARGSKQISAAKSAIRVSTWSPVNSTFSRSSCRSAVISHRREWST